MNRPSPEKNQTSPDRGRESRGKPWKNLNPVQLLLASLILLLLPLFWTSGNQDVHVSYSEFRQLLSSGSLSEVIQQGDVIRARLKLPREDGRDTVATRRFDPQLAKELAAQDVVFSNRPPNTFIPTVLSWLFPVAILVGVWLFLMRRASERMGGGGGLLSVGKSKAKVYVVDDTRVSFAEVAGVDEAKQELEEVVEFLREPASYGRLGARMPKGILLVGPPGTGKTLLARAVAGEAGVPFFSISGSEFVEMFVGVGAARVRDLFERAREKSPCIIFIDELDALGKARNSQQGVSGHDEKEQTLNQLLVELDGFDPRSGIVLLGATNRPEILDPALLRAGRFDRQVLVDRPDRNGRVEILKVHLRGILTDENLDPDKVAALTPGFTGADLANLVNEAALVATRRRAALVEAPDFNEAIERIVAGLEKRNRLLNPREREIVAHHEMGHALVAAALPDTDRVQKVSIIPRGIGALGYTLQRPTEDRYLMTKEEMEVKLAVLQGGRAAERVIFGHFSTGAADDLSRATDIARSMVTRYGMVPELGSAVYADAEMSMLGAGQIPTGRRHSEQTAREIDEAVRSIVDRSFDTAIAILERHRDILEDSASDLLAKESLGEEELRVYFSRLCVSEPRATSPIAVNF